MASLSTESADWFGSFRFFSFFLFVFFLGWVCFTKQRRTLMSCGELRSDCGTGRRLHSTDCAAARPAAAPRAISVSAAAPCAFAFVRSGKSARVHTVQAIEPNQNPIQLGETLSNSFRSVVPKETASRTINWAKFLQIINEKFHCKFHKSTRNTQLNQTRQQEIKSIR